jgi:hypothetical protein
MPLTVTVKSESDSTKAHREEVAGRVIAQFGNRLPDFSLLCFFDDTDWQSAKQTIGKANRGLAGPIKDDLCEWPEYVRRCVIVDDPLRPSKKRLFDHIIYLHGSTCTNDVGLAMTFAHELQHFVQYGNVRTLWAANSLIRNLPKETISTLGLTWFDIPIEREARAVSKQTAENLFGVEAVRQYIDARIIENVDANDTADWQFIRGLVAASPYDLAVESGLIFQRLKNYRANLELLLREHNDDPDYADVDLSALLGDATD